ncbi:MAG: protein translocase subunit SecD [Candidatus Eisenbacteria bacterium]
MTPYRWKLLIFIVVLAIAGYALWPSIQLYRMPAEERYGSDPDVAALREESLKLGLDLLGGMRLVLQLDRTQLSAEEVPDALDRAMEVLRNRIDQFGVAEPTLQKQGEDRILIQLPGLLDKQRAIDLIGQTALLEFKLVQQEAKTRQVIDRLDRAIAAALSGAAVSDSLLADSLSNELDTSRPLRSLLYDYPSLSMGAPAVAPGDVARVQELLDLVDLDSVVPSDSEVALSSKTQSVGEGAAGYHLYVLKKHPEMTGAAIKNAVMQIGLDPTRPSASGVSMTMNAQGTTDFRRVTSVNVGRQLAIVLDQKVASAPFIRGKIPNGHAQITGSFSDAEANDLAIVLRAGALPAPVNIIEERTVGPSLGRDSIQTSLRAALLGAALVVGFMAIYYRMSGLVAVLALVLNITFLFAGLALFRGTLTLPGIAGIVLTIGMAVDANVLIFERIREELRSGKRPRLAIASGFDRAFTTILDANLTTLISAVVLWSFGTGPIKGFAVTLGIGILANLYTAVVVTRMVFDTITANRSMDELSI